VTQELPLTPLPPMVDFSPWRPVTMAVLAQVLMIKSSNLMDSGLYSPATG
jgi:hypothetical protein